MSSTETLDVPSFIGTKPADEYRTTMPGETFVAPYAGTVRITLSDGTLREYIGTWTRKVYDGGSTTMTEEGSQHYALSGTGELYVVMTWTVTHYIPGGGWKEIITNESVEITYAAHAWVSADGPRGDAPEKDHRERYYPDADGNRRDARDFRAGQGEGKRDGNG